MIDLRKIRRRGEKGQGFMELAISMVFLLILLSVVIELGWAFYEMIALRDAAQEAASFAAMCPPENGETLIPPTGNTALIWDRLRLSMSTPLNSNDLDPNGVSIEMFDPDGNPITVPEMGGTIRIEVTYGHKIKAPFVGTFLGRYEYELKVDVSNTIMRDDCTGL